jgi:hypothetical protein
LILEKMKIQITIEEQMLEPPFLCFSPVPRLRSAFNLQPSILALSAVEGPAPSAVEGFNRQHLILEKGNSNNNSKQLPKPFFFPRFAPDFGPGEAKKGRIECPLHQIVPKQFTASHDGVHPSWPSQLPVAHRHLQSSSLPTFRPSTPPIANQRNHFSQRLAVQPPAP